MSSRAGLTPVVRTAEDLTLDTLRAWLADVVAEPAGADGAFTLLAGFACHCLRARLDDTWAGRSTFPLLDGPRMLELPLEQRNDGPWVAGPIDDLRVPAPMEYQLDFGAGGLRVAIHSRWSWWYEPGRPEHAALAGALGRLVARGWTPSEVPDAFRPAVAGPPYVARLTLTFLSARTFGENAVRSLLGLLERGVGPLAITGVEPADPYAAAALVAAHEPVTATLLVGGARVGPVELAATSLGDGSSALGFDLGGLGITPRLTARPALRALAELVGDAARVLSADVALVAAEPPTSLDPLDPAAPLVLAWARVSAAAVVEPLLAGAWSMDRAWDGSVLVVPNRPDPVGRDASSRRQAVRWIGESGNQRDAYRLGPALDDPDWEVRVGAMIAAVRLGARELARAVRRTPLPATSREGLDPGDRSLLHAVRQAVTAVLSGRAPHAPDHLVDRLQFGSSGGEDGLSLFLHALGRPLPAPVPRPPQLPDGVERFASEFVLRPAGLPLVWVPPVEHWLGEDGFENPIRRVTPPKGFSSPPCRWTVFARGRTPAAVAQPSARAPRCQRRTSGDGRARSRRPAISLGQRVRSRHGVAVGASAGGRRRPPVDSDRVRRGSPCGVRGTRPAPVCVEGSRGGSARAARAATSGPRRGLAPASGARIAIARTGAQHATRGGIHLTR